jgi:tripartite-type tricarboxylate transporter receptor subunit TctC
MPACLLSIAVVAATVLRAPVRAQDYPARPVRIVAPAAPGGSFDVLGRLLAQALTEKWGQRAFVDNRPGAGGNLGAVAKAEPDGYTLLVWNDSLLINPSLFAEVPFDPKRDFTPLSLSIYVPNVLVAHPSANMRSFADFLRMASANPGKYSYGSPGNGTPGHLSFELLKQLRGLDVQHVPYRGAGPALIDLVGGQIPLGMVAVPGAIGHIKSGALIALAVTSAQRVEALPDIPTVAEAGVPDYRVNAWHGVLAPANLPPAIAGKLEADLAAVLADPAIRRKLVEFGFEPVGGGAKQLADIIDRDLPVWREIVRKSGAKAE